MKKMYVFSLISGLALAVQATEAAAPRDEDLIAAARAGDAAEVRRLIAAGADVNAKVAGETALMKAAHWGHADVVQALLAVEGIEVNAQDKYGYSALIIASIKGHADVVRMLLEKDADHTIKNWFGKKAADYAGDHGHHEIKAMLEEAYVKPAR